MGGTCGQILFQLVLIKPTHYDDDGYPITWLKSLMPSNTLAALYGLGDDCLRRQVLGPDVEIVIKPLDEANTRVRPDRIIADFLRNGGKGLISYGQKIETVEKEVVPGVALTGEVSFRTTRSHAYKTGFSSVGDGSASL